MRTPPQRVWDLAVVGAGPAGCAAALGALRAEPRVRVLLLDRAEFPRDKPCGDGIAPQAIDVLDGLGVPDVAAGFPPVSRLEITGPGGGVVGRDMRRPAHVIPRRVFDARLVEAAVAAGAVLERRTVRAVDVGTTAVVLDDEVRARVAVGADGANGIVRRALGLPAQPAGHLAVALRAYAAVPPTGQPAQRIVMDGGAWPAYAWAFPIGDGSANVGYGAVLRRGWRPTRKYLLGRLRTLLPELGPLSRLRGHHLPLASHRPLQPDGRLLLAGDAAALINPFTGEGIFYALASGALAGRTAVTASSHAEQGAVGQRYRRELRRRLGRHLAHIRATAALGSWAPVVDAGVRAAARDAAVFDALVELGLADGRLTPRVVGRTLYCLPAARRPGRPPARRAVEGP